MGHRWHDFSLCGAVAGELVGRDVDRHLSLTLQQLTKEAFCGTIVLALLQQELQNITILVNSPPQNCAFALNRHDDLIEIAAIAECCTGLIGSDERSRCQILRTTASPIYQYFIREKRPTFIQRMLESLRTHAAGARVEAFSSSNVLFSLALQPRHHHHHNSIVKTVQNRWGEQMTHWSVENPQ